VPFAQLSFVEGSIARELGCDIAWLPGLLLPGVIYIVAGKSLLAQKVPRFSG
jgi:nucleobase:cation symporter-1, NCS1 family